MKRIILLMMCVFLFSQTGFAACQFDSDCELGAICMKPLDSHDGWCTGGMKSIDYTVGKRPMDQADFLVRSGRTCEVDSDCGANGTCAKGTSHFGICL